MLISQKSRRLPIELYNEIIGFLWNDFPSLKACALASRVLLAPSQKRLFYSIGLNAYSGLSYGSSIRELMGRPSSFYWCLARSPHLADYVQALHICDEAHSRDLDVESTDVTPPVLGNEHDPHFDKDYKFTNGMEISDLDHAIQPPTNRRMVGGWLPRDKFLPLFAPLLSNLKALCIFYPFDWHCLTYKVLFTLLSLMQLPSLVHLRLLFDTYPQSIVSMAFGENIKHLALDSTQRDDNFPFQLEHPPLQPVYLESFLVCSPFVFLDHFPPTSRIQFSRLRKLAVVACSANDHPATQKLLRQCRDTLEDFEFNPSLWDASRLTIHEMMDAITLSGLTSLKRLAVTLSISKDNEDSNILAPFPWLSNLLRSGYSTSATQHLEELSIRVFSEIAYTPTREVIPIPWKPLFNALLEDELKNLRLLNISIAGRFTTEEMAVVLERLNGRKAMAKLRCRPGLVLNVRVFDQPFLFEQDIRWETHDWTKWTDVNLP